MPDGIVLRKILLAIGVLIAPAAHAQALKAGQPAPEFTLPKLDGDSAHLASSRGHPVILEFWATWCPSCQTEMPQLDSIRSAHRDAGLEVIAINGEDSADKIRKYLAKLGLGTSFTALLDPKARVGEKRYHIVALPTTMFVDSAGVVRVNHSGPITQAEFAAGVRSILTVHNQE